MRLKPVFLSVGMVSLSMSYVLFTNQQYFSALSMVALYVLAALAAVLLVFAPKLESSRNRYLYLAASVALIAAISAYEVSFSLVGSQDLSFAVYVGSIVSVATAVSVIGIYLTSRAMKGSRGYAVFLVPLLCLILTSIIAYLVMYGFRAPNWNGVDELAYNYYSAVLFLHGVNPYTSSMQPILTQRHIYPTLQLDGTFEYAYDYPPLSFLAFMPIPLLGITSFMSFIGVVVVMSVFACFLVYRRSGHDRNLLLPIAVWIFFSYIVVGTASHYLAIVIFLFLAYLERKNALLSGVLLGLAASTIQLAWFFLPFFYVLELREFGKDHFIRQAGASALTFVVICAYFVALSPQQTLGNIFALFGLNRLVFYGINLMQFSYAFYPVAYWYSAFLSVTALLLLLALFYFYTKSLLPMLAVVPAMIFFLSWRNITLYSLPAFPLLLALYYTESGVGDLVRNKRYAAYALLCFAVIALAVAAYSHSAYVQQQGIVIDRITPILSLQSSTYYGLGGFIANISSGEPEPQNVSFYVISRSPDLEGYTPGELLPQLQPGSSGSYNVSYQLPMVNNQTQLFIFVFSKYYVASREVNLTVSAPPGSVRPLG